MRFSDVLVIMTLLSGTAFGQSREDVAEYAAAYFGEQAQVAPLQLKLSSVETAMLSKINGARHPWEKVALWRVDSDGECKGVIMVDNVKGKARPITYLVAFERTGAIHAVEVLAYRESHGGEVRSPLFLEQFAEKSHDDALRVGQDIRNISGATISSRALTRGAHALATYMHYLIAEKKL